MRSFAKLSATALAAMAVGLPAAAWAQQYPEAAGFASCTDGGGQDSVGHTEYYCTGPADVTYTITVEKVGFKRSDGTFFWLNGTKTFNVASASAGAMVGAYLTGISLPNGTYTEIHAVIDLRQTVQGSGVVVGGTGGAVTCPAGSRTAIRGYVNPDETCAGLGIPAPYENNITALQGCVDGTYSYGAGALSPNLVINGPSTTATIGINFDVSRGILYDLGTNNPATTCSFAASPIGKLTPAFTVTQ